MSMWKETMTDDSEKKIVQMKTSAQIVREGESLMTELFATQHCLLTSIEAEYLDRICSPQLKCGFKKWRLLLDRIDRFGSLHKKTISKYNR